MDWPVADGGAHDAKGMVRIPAAFAQAGAQENDALLVASGTALRYLTYDPVSARSVVGTTGFAAAAVSASSAWQQVVQLEVHATETTLWLVGLAADQHQVLVGQWTPNGIEDVGSFVSAGVVKQLLFVDFANNGAVQIAVRTTTALEFWTPAGTLARPPVAAPTASVFGCLARLRDDGEQHVAWLVLSGSQWQLRVYDASTQLQDTTVLAPGFMPTRFRPVGLGAIAWEGTCDALVLSQSTTTSQLVLTKVAGVFQPALSFQCPGMTYPVDNCPPLLDDLNNDGQPDFTMVLSSQRGVQITTDLAPPQAFQYLAGPNNADILPVACSMGQGPTGVPNATINLHVQVPQSYYQAYPDLEVQVVSWPQYVNDPGSGERPDAPVGDADANWFFPIIGSTGINYGPTPILPFALPRTSTEAWTPHEHYFLMVRFVRRASGTVFWTSPARMMGFVAQMGNAPAYPNELTYLHSISSPGGHGQVVVPGGNRNVGVILKPDSIDPPNSSVKVPNSGPSQTRNPSGPW